MRDGSIIFFTGKSGNLGRLKGYTEITHRYSEDETTLNVTTTTRRSEIEYYTEEDIENLRGSHFPKWIREALVKYKKRGGKSVETTAFEIAMQMIEAQKNLKDTCSK